MGGLSKKEGLSCIFIISFPLDREEKGQLFKSVKVRPKDRPKCLFGKRFCISKDTFLPTYSYLLSLAHSLIYCIGVRPPGH